MIAEGVRIPTVAETVRTYVRRLTSGELDKRGRVLLLAFLLVAFVLPPISLERTWPGLAILVAITSIQEARRERRLGGPDRLVLVAGLTSAAVVSLYSIVLLLILVYVGGRLDLWSHVPPVDLPVEVIVIGILAIEALLFYIFWRTRAGRERAEEAFESEVRAERARRGAPPERRRWS